MNALRRIQAALLPGGVVVDTQPVGAWPTVSTPAGELGALDMRGWKEIIDAVDERVDTVVGEGLFVSETKPGFVVKDSFDSGAALSETVKNWQGTVIPAKLAERLARHDAPAQVHQDVRFRLLRAL